MIRHMNGTAVALAAGMLVAGAAQAAEKARDREKATTYYARLVDLAQKADTERPEIREAKAFLASK